MERKLFLDQFHTIGTDDYQLLLDTLKSKQCSKGEMLTVPGQYQRQLYFVNQGVQMSYYGHEDKKHVIAFTYAPGLCAIPEAFSLQKPSKYFLTCLTDSEFDYITYEDLQLLFDQSQQIERLFRKMAEHLLAGVVSRHLELHAMTIEERFVAFCRRSPHLLNLVPNKYISSYLDIDPTNFSKLLNRVKF
jgi:CRP-like cAMP-binding protein